MRTRAPFLLGVAALGLCFAAALPCVAQGSVAPGSSAPTGRYSLRVEGCPESLRARFGLDSLATSRLWDGADLEPMAIRIRDFLAANGDWGATVRLSLHPGQGSAPGSARLALIRDADPAAPAAAAPVAPVQAAR